MPADLAQDGRIRENLVMTEPADPWRDRAFLRDVQYKSDANLAARQSIYSYQHPRIDLQALVVDLAAVEPGETVADVGCGNGRYLAELARRGLAGLIIGADLSTGMLTAARERLSATVGPVKLRDSGESGPADSAGPASSSGLAGSADLAGSAVLLAADATALPLRDGAADLTLAMHMLYHAPDPAQAARELRRVTRTGGRVVIGLNGADHLRELREIVAAASGNDRWKRRERLTLDVGEAMARSCFSTVTRHDFVGQLRLPVKEPVADYLRSMSLTQAADDPERHVAAVLSRLSAGPGAPFTITTHAGCLICEV